MQGACMWTEDQSTKEEADEQHEKPSQRRSQHQPPQGWSPRRQALRPSFNVSRLHHGLPHLVLILLLPIFVTPLSLFAAEAQMDADASSYGSRDERLPQGCD